MTLNTHRKVCRAVLMSSNRGIGKTHTGNRVPNFLNGLVISFWDTAVMMDFSSLIRPYI